MKEDAPQVHGSGNLLAHKHVSRGNAKEAIANAKYVYTEEFHTPWTEHAFLEPECAIAMPYEDGVLIYSTDQGTYATQHECSEMLGLPSEKSPGCQQTGGRRIRRKRGYVCAASCVTGGLSAETSGQSKTNATGKHPDPSETASDGYEIYGWM